MLFKGGRIISPAEKIDKVGDLLVKDFQISAMDENIVPSEGTLIIDATDMVISPGFIDIHCHLREPDSNIKRPSLQEQRQLQREDSQLYAPCQIQIPLWIHEQRLISLCVKPRKRVQ